MKLNNAKDIRLGDQQIKAVYLGEQLIWPKNTEPPAPLPYDRLLAIEGNNSPYIDTGYIHKANTKIVCDCTMLSGNYQWEWLFGSRVGETGYTNSFQVLKRYYSTDSLYYLRTPVNGVENRTGDVTLNKRCLVTAEGNRITMAYEGEEVQTYEISDTVDNGLNSMFIFGCNDSPTPGGHRLCANCTSHMRLYGFRIYEGDKLLHDFIPARRKDDGAICLYDTVTKTFRENSGNVGNPFIAVEEV